MLQADLYRTIFTIRRFEERVVELVNENKIAGVTHECIGQEAVAAGVCAALRPSDVITSTHRGHGHVIAKGADVAAMMAELFGRESGLNRGRGGSMHIADLSLGIYGANGMVGAGAPFAAGAAWAALRSRSDRVAVTFFGDGAINQGVVMETMNLAALWALPMLFVCENNGYAVSLSSHESTAGSIVDRAAAYGMPSHSADGMDVEVVLGATREAVDRAREGSGPSFLEFRTYRYAGHHTAEATMKLSYRTQDEIDQWRLRDPVGIAGGRLESGTRDEIEADVERLLDEAVAFADAGTWPAAREVLTDVYASGLVARDGVA
jgi:TPP-dependent pyruvate/acetoin dehydrogenase alpha subunit